MQRQICASCAIARSERRPSNAQRRMHGARAATPERRPSGRRATRERRPTHPLALFVDHACCVLEELHEPDTLARPWLTVSMGEVGRPGTQT